MRNHSYENDFELHENAETASRTHFHKEGFTLGLVSKQRHKRTRKCTIIYKRFLLLTYPWFLGRGGREGEGEKKDLYGWGEVDG